MCAAFAVCLRVVGGAWGSESGVCIGYLPHAGMCIFSYVRNACTRHLPTSSHTVLPSLRRRTQSSCRLAAAATAAAAALEVSASA